MDVLENRTPEADSSSLIWKLCEAGVVKGSVSVLSFANMVYSMRKDLSPKKIDSILKRLSMIFSWEDLTQSDLTNAASLCWKDYEDAIQSSVACRIGAEFIITRNVKDFNQSVVPACTPTDYLKKINNN